MRARFQVRPVRWPCQLRSGRSCALHGAPLLDMSHGNSMSSSRNVTTVRKRA